MKKSIYAVLATALLAVIVMPIAFAGADGPQAGASAKGSAAVNKQLKALKLRIAALEARQTPVTLPPSGPAGGDLTGSYPNPLIKPNAITTNKLAPKAVTEPKIADYAVTTEKIEVGAVTSLKLADGSVFGNRLMDGAVTSAKIADGDIKAVDMGADSVGAIALKGVVAAVTTEGVSIDNGDVETATVTCPAGRMLIAGGFAWKDGEANSIISSAPSESNPNTTWVVEGMPTGGSSNVLYAWANCILA